MVIDTSIKILEQHLRHYDITTFIMVDIFIEILIYFAIYLFAC